MRLLILGGSGFVGRTLAEQAVRRGDDVTVFNRGLRPPPAGVRLLTGDRLAGGGLSALDNDEQWDAITDTWSADSEAVRRTASLLRDRAGVYQYVSTRSVYAYGTPQPLTEDSPLADVDDAEYAGDKLRGEMAVREFGGGALMARAGLILGPHEDVGRLPWWLNRLARGGPALAPGPRELPLQYIDVRDLALFLLDAVPRGLTGAYNVVSPSGHATMGELLDTANEVTGGTAELRWTAPEVIEAAGIEPWIQLPIWLPPGPDHDHLHRGDVTKALTHGLTVRPVRETVADTWAWLRSLPGDPPRRTDRARVGLDPAVEAKVLGE
ncbi:NAD-dependent epimerase/dehydratase family protein [Actinoplanes sp. TBRC 11911]|uniref:NAD-dependent epimerase/dehydratase family protein n=1 Tax=Actinoplanes sp. TBRC 11911 TaxID=2729386 RepID=UPI00145D865A|nr:NAD-dependent epimerase/dehydratase family protein [Actinoplanes sp. TBRC 11911]NMO52720.1 NAD-dependent epimerase/dehydratase family protein [Actinoplanes sp. TBRC 11911]